MCPKCRSMRAEWAKVKGTGKVFSYTIGYRGLENDWSNDKPPLIVAVVALDEFPMYGCSPISSNANPKRSEWICRWR